MSRENNIYDSLRELEARQRIEAERREAEKAARLAAAMRDPIRRDYRELDAVAARQTEAKAAEATKQREAEAAKAQQQAEEYWQRAAREKQAPHDEAKKQADKLKEERASQDAALLRVAELAQKARDTTSNPQRLRPQLDELYLREEREVKYQIERTLKTEPQNFEKEDRQLAYLADVHKAIYNPQQIIKELEAKRAEQERSTGQQRPQPERAPQQGTERTAFQTEQTRRETLRHGGDLVARHETRVADHNRAADATRQPSQRAGAEAKPGREVSDRSREQSDAKQERSGREAFSRALNNLERERSEERAQGRDGGRSRDR